MEFPTPSLISLQLQSYLVPCMSPLIFIIRRSQNIHWQHFHVLSVTLGGHFFSLHRKHLPHCYSVRFSDWSFKEHISRAHPTTLIFYLLRSIPSDFLELRGDNSKDSKLEGLEIIIKWLQVSVSDCNQQTLRLRLRIQYGS